MVIKLAFKITNKLNKSNQIMSETPKNQNTFNFHAPVGTANAGDITVQGDSIGIQNNYAQEQSLADAAKEIQDLLNQLAQSNPTTTEYEKQILVNKFNEEVKTNSRIRDMILVGGIELVKILCPPLGIPIEMGKKWLETAQKNNPRSEKNSNQPST
jgi:cell division protein ZapA (FtsZ GTPase activity inhibitor)